MPLVPQAGTGGYLRPGYSIDTPMKVDELPKSNSDSNFVQLGNTVYQWSGKSWSPVKYLKAGGMLNGYPRGGRVSGAGTGTSDSIPAMLSNGEYVIKASSVKKYGAGTMDAINSGTIKMMLGGDVTSTQAQFLMGQQIPGKVENPKTSAASNATAAQQSAYSAGFSSAFPGFNSGFVAPFAAPNSDGQLAVNYAAAQIGDSYSLNPDPPNTWGCSVLTAWAYGEGVPDGWKKYPWDTYSTSQMDSSNKILSRASGAPGDGSSPQIPEIGLLPGDLIYFTNTGIGPSGKHIGLYAGPGQLLHAGDPVQKSDLQSDWNRLYFDSAARPVPKFATGGIIKGQGTGTSDSILARVSHGEYVINADATRRNKGILDAINNGTQLPKFSIPNAPSMSSVHNIADSRTSNSIVVNVNGAKDSKKVAFDVLDIIEKNLSKFNNNSRMVV
jgi:cell wall-associated NlpC family hydrolase